MVSTYMNIPSAVSDHWRGFTNPDSDCSRLMYGSA